MSSREDFHYPDRDCKPAQKPLKLSYYQGLCSEPLCNKTISQLLEKAAKASPQHVVFRCPEFNQEINLHALLDRADAVSRALLSLGMKKGDVIFLTGVSDIEYFVLFFAITQIGMIFHYPEVYEPADKNFPGKISINPDAMFVGRACGKELLDLVRDYTEKARLSNLKYTIGMNALDHTANILSYEEFLQKGHEVSVENLKIAKKQVSTDDVAVIASTTGTTSEPKRPCHTHFELANLTKFGAVRVLPYKQKEVLGSPNPFTDDMIFLHILRPIYYFDDDITMVLAPSNLDMDDESTEGFIEFFHNERITWYLGMPFQLIKVTESPLLSKYDISSLRGGVLVSHAVSEDVKGKLLAKYKDLVTTYGSTEAIAVTTTSPVMSSPEQRCKTVGYGFPHCEVKLVDSYGSIVSIGEIGELMTRGWSTFKCYWNEPEKTATAKDTAGWVRLKDIGCMDDTGHVTYIGRSSDCIRFKHVGIQLYPKEILDIAMACDKVQEAKVIGVPNDLAGDVVCLFVEKKKGCSLTEKELQDAMESTLALAFRPDCYYVLDELPRIGSRNKIWNAKLQQIAEATWRTKIVTI